MDELNILTRIVTGRKVPVTPLLDFNDKKGSNKETKLIRLLERSPNSTPLQLTRLLYAKTTPASQAAFRKLKSRVQQKLLNNLYFFEHSDNRFPISRRYESQCIELYHQANVLKLEGEYSLSERLMRKCLRIAQEAEFTQYAVLSAQALRALYADLRQPSQYRTICLELTRFQELFLLEEKAAQLYSDTKMALALTVKSRRFLLEELPAYTAKLQELHDQAQSYNTFNYLYLNKISQQELVGNYEELINITATTARQLAEGKINKKRFDKRFNNFMSVYAHLRSRRVKEGLILAEQYLHDFHPSSGNWFYFLEHYFLLAMHAGNYVQARELLVMARKNPFYRIQRLAPQQRWDLYDAYLQFVLPELSPARAMQFSQFVQTVPDYGRDKQGYNVAILILQFLYYLRRNDIETLLARLEGLRKYQLTHLRDPATLRSQLFFRLLLLTVKKNFDPKASERHGQQLLARLREAPQPGEAFAEIEIIPYEDLWELTLSIMRVTAYNASK